MSTSYRMVHTTTTHATHHVGGDRHLHAADDFVAATEREKVEMQELNSRLEIYIGRVKQLEETNKQLVIELDQLRGSLGSDVGQIKFKYNDSLVSARKDIIDAATSSINVEVRVNRLRDDLADYRNRYEEARREIDREKTSWGGAIAQATAELENNKSRYAAILDEEKRLYAEQEALYGQLASAKDELDAAIADRLRLQNQEEGLKNELEFLGRVHSQELSELRALLSQAPADTREFFKTELAQAIRDIKAEYDKIIATTKLDLETIFQSKIDAIEASVSSKNDAAHYRQEEIFKMNTSITSLRAKLAELEAKNHELEREANSLNIQLGDDQRQYEQELLKRDNQLRFMREDCQTLIAELQSLLNTKQTLDTEIAIYRKLVESEENRTQTQHQASTSTSTRVGQGVRPSAEGHPTSGIAPGTAGAGYVSSTFAGSTQGARGVGYGGVRPVEGSIRYEVRSGHDSGIGHGVTPSQSGAGYGVRSSDRYEVRGGHDAGIGHGVAPAQAHSGTSDSHIEYKTGSGSGGYGGYSSGHEYPAGDYKSTVQIGGVDSGVGKFEVEKDIWASGEIRSTFKRHAKGNVSITECDPNGRFIILENTSGAVTEQVGGFQIRRVLDGVTAFTYTLPSPLAIHPRGHLKIYGQQAGGIHSPPETIVMESHPNWGQGHRVETTLYNLQGAEKASHIQTNESH